MKRDLPRDIFRSLSSPARLRYMLTVLRFLAGFHPRTCNLCGHEGRFDALGHPPRYDALCPKCGSRERHRLFGLLLERRSDLIGGRLVHFAPEPSLTALLERRAADYATSDPEIEGCDLRLDIQAIALPDASVDTFVLHQVLEHLPDDRAALAELYRCLVSGGRVLLSVPIIEGWPHSYEDPAVAAAGPAVRALHFGWPDHLRYYGADLRERIAQAGFALEEFVADGAEVVRHGLIRGETIFIAEKPRAGNAPR